MDYIIEEELGFGKAISKFAKAINKLESKNSAAMPKNEKDKSSKEKVKNIISLLKDNVKVIKEMNSRNESDFETKEELKRFKLEIKKMVADQKKTIATLKNPTIVKYLKSLGLGLLTGGIIAGTSYFFNNLAIKYPAEIKVLNQTSREARLMPGGLITGILGMNRETFDKYTPKEFMKFSAAEAGAWTGLLAAKNMKDYYKDGYNVKSYRTENKNQIKESYYFQY